MLDFFAAAPPEVARAFDLAVLDLGDAAAFSMGAHPKMLLFNRVLGLEADAALPDIERWFAARGCIFAVSTHAGVELADALDERGYRLGSRLMKFRRGVEQPPVHKTSLRIEQIHEERAADYGAVVAAVFGLGSPLDRWFAALSTRMRWVCLGAFDGSRLIGATPPTGGSRKTAAASTSSGKSEPNNGQQHEETSHRLRLGGHSRTLGAGRSRRARPGGETALPPER